MTWHGYRNSTPVDDTPGVLLDAQNVRLSINGEARRRRGMARSSIAKLSGSVGAISDFALSPGRPQVVTLYGGSSIDGVDGISAQWGDVSMKPAYGYSAPFTGSTFSITIYRGDNYARSYLIYGKIGSYPNDFVLGEYLGEVSINPWDTSVTTSVTPSSAGQWFFRVYPVRDRQEGPGANIDVMRLLSLGLSGSLAFSVDGVTWFNEGTTAFGSTGMLRGLYVPSLSKWFAAGGSGTIGYSADGLTWTTVTSSFGSDTVYGLSYMGGTLLAVGANSKAATSTDGITWTARTHGMDTGAYRVCTNGSIWVVAGQHSGGNAVMIQTTTDGITYTTRHNPALAYVLPAVAWGNSLFVAGGGNDATNTSYIVTSPDGITWTSRTISTNKQVQDVAYGTPNGSALWVAVGDSNTIATSPDGITWTNRTGVHTGQDIQAVIWHNNIFIAAGTNGLVSTSPDGITWTLRTGANGTNSIRGLATYAGLP